MPKKGKQRKNRRPSNFGAKDEPGSSNPNLDWAKCTEEEQLERIIRKKLENLYFEALARLIGEGYDEDAALKGLLERGYCVGEADCLSSIVLNSSNFLAGKDEVDESEEQDQDRPQPFMDLESAVEFNMHFMIYILLKYRPNLNRITALQCILIADLNVNRAINLTDDLNLVDDNDDDGDFLNLEFNNLNLLDDSVVSEETKDAIIAGSQNSIVSIRWASKKLAEAIRKHSSTSETLSIHEKIQLLKYFTEIRLRNRDFELSSMNNELGNAEKTVKGLEMVKKEIIAEISASKLIESEAEQKLLEEVSKKGRKKKKKNSEKQKVELQEEIELEKKKISKLEQELVEAEAALIPAVVELGEVIKARKTMITQVDKEYELILDSWDNNILLEEAAKMTNALSKARHEVQVRRTEFTRLLSEG